jgi:hypothetical protein
MAKNYKEAKNFKPQTSGKAQASNFTLLSAKFEV